ncbi:hypothetical protein BGW42_008086 [Actinomortierella wolfii]|nr:hypothetical protein BGW42_008086 [Actinomortierella wolfii]
MKGFLQLLTGNASNNTVDQQKVLEHDELVLEKLGYKQTLDRSLSAFKTFGVSFSCCSVISGLTILLGDALQSGGPVTVVWGWPIVAFFTLMVGLSLAEICSAFPTTGGLYFWTTKLASADWVPVASWMTGYFNWLGLFTTFGIAIASTDLAMAQFLGSVISMTTSYNPSTYVIFAIYIGILFLHGFINSMAVRMNGIFNSVSVWWHIFGTVILIAVPLAKTPEFAPASFVFTQWVNETGWSSGFYVFMLGLLQSQYTLSGYDAAAHMAEETQDAQKGGPMGIIWAIVSSFVAGWVFLIGITFCITDFQGQVIEPAVGVTLAQIFLDHVGRSGTIFLIIIILGGQFFCGSALTLASSRMVYAFARDGALPLSKYLRRLDKHKSPVAAVWFNIAFSLILGIPYMWSDEVYSAIVSVNTIASSVSYLIPILCRIILARKTFQPGPFHLGRFSIPVGVISSLWIGITSILFVCPTQYPVTAGNMNYALVPFVLVIGLCTIYYAVWGRKWFRPGSGRDFGDDAGSMEQTDSDSKAVGMGSTFPNEKEEL